MLVLRRFPAGLGQTGLAARKLAVMLACCVILIPDGFSAAPASGGGKPLPPLNTYDGLTRESLSDLDAPPEPAPLAAASAASLQDTQDASRARSIARQHRRARRHRLMAQAPPPVVVVKSTPRRRNPAESFVYWWNGMVIRNLHTKFGTVLLDKIGAKA